MLFFSASVTPSLLPRPYYVQGVLSAFAIAVGYSLGVGLVLLYQFLELPNPNDRMQRIAKALSGRHAGVPALRRYRNWKAADTTRLKTVFAPASAND